jgi:glutathione peroxidase
VPNESRRNEALIELHRAATGTLLPAARAGGDGGTLLRTEPCVALNWRLPSRSCSRPELQWLMPVPSCLTAPSPGLLDGKPRSLCQYSGRVLLIVNTASRCGFTRQYEGLEKLQDRFGGRGLTVLGFPSNDFGNQEPGSDKDIAQFCSMTYGVKFPMFSKTSVTGSGKHPLYADLSRISGVEPAWNFPQVSGRSRRQYDRVISGQCRCLNRLN